MDDAKKTDRLATENVCAVSAGLVKSSWQSVCKGTGNDISYEARFGRYGGLWPSGHDEHTQKTAVFHGRWCAACATMTTQRT
jgi:hypothetical protein